MQQIPFIGVAKELERLSVALRDGKRLASAGPAIRQIAPAAEGAGISES